MLTIATIAPYPKSKILAFFLFFLFPSLAFPLDYYWIGNSGGWSDLSHWVTTSGGTVQHDQIPTASDRVIFDQNSFTGPTNKITLNLDIIFCQDLDFRSIDQPVEIIGPSSTVMSIHGSLFMHPDVSLNYKGSFDFKSSAPNNELHWQGQKPFRLNFLGQGGWTMATDVQVDSLIHIEFGNLKFDPVQITCQRFEVYSQAVVDLNFGSATIQITGNRFLQMPSYQWKESLHFEGGQVNVTPGNSTIQLTGQRASLGFHYLNEVNLDNVEVGVAGGDHLIYATWLGNFTFKQLHLKGNTYLQGAFNLKELELDGGNVYTFQSDFEQETGEIRVNTGCSKTALIKASEGGRSANFRATQGRQSLEYLMIQDIHVNGATYQASHAVDLGGNQGWDIQIKSSETFYWIGGSGNWSDINHWSFSSGGTPSGCLPTATDDVIFDQSSFTGANQQVTLNIPNAFCHSFDWRQVDRPCQFSNLNLPNKVSIHVFGSLWLSDIMTNNFTGDFLFESPHGANEILTEGHEFNLNVHFNSSLGEWTLLDKLDVRDTLFFNAGTLNTNDKPLESFYLLSESNARRTLNLGRSTWRIVMTDDHPYYWSEIRLNANNLTINPGTSLIKCENSTNLNSYGDGEVDLYEIIFEGFGGVNTDYNNATEFNIKKATFLSDGDFRNEMNIDTLIFSPGWKYTMYMNSLINIDSLSARGNCDGSIYFAAFPKGIQGTLHKSNGSISTSELILEGIVGEGGATFLAQSSVDLGKNDGWTFTDKAARTLYWVGQDALWHDRQNWSLISGGPGGECIPTAIDNVIFDQNSFTDMWQRVGLGGSRSPICHDMTWQEVPNFVRIDDGDLYLTGNLTLEPNIDFQPWTLLFNSDSLQNQITTSGNQINWVDFMGSGSWILVDDFHVPYNINFKSGTLKTNDQKLTTGHFSMDNYPIDFERKLILDNSHILFSPMPIWQEQLFINSNNFIIEPGNSLVEFEGDAALSRHYGSATLNLHQVLFSNPLGTSTIEQWDETHFNFNKLQINNNGIIYGANDMDSLLLAAGKEYELELRKRQTVNSYLLAIGNNCTPISIRSTEPGQQSTIFSKSAKVVADFVQLQDQIATGGADFTAGSHSTDISNNTGWVFDPAPDHIDIGFLGADRTLCRDSAITLSAYNFSPNETYLWSDVSTNVTLPVANSGTFWAQVTFKNNCVITDTVQVRDPLSLQVDLGSDSSLCEGELLVLDGDIRFPEAMYTWQDGSDHPQLAVADSGLYHVAVEVDGCTFADSILVDYNPLPKVNIQGAASVCIGDTLQLDASAAAGTYRWQDGSTQSLLEVVSDGTYWVEVEKENCRSTDSVDIVFTSKPPLDLGADTTLCQNEELSLNAFVDNSLYEWQDGTSAEEIIVADAGLYWVELTRENCSIRDTIVVDYQPLPQLGKLVDTALCTGTQWEISLNEPNVSYAWNTGLQTGTIQIDQPGDYSVTARLDECEIADSFNVHFEAPPILDLGDDLTLCEGEAVDLGVSEPSVTYIWQDSITDPTFTIRESGTYQVTAHKLNCSVHDTINVLVNPLPLFSLGSDLHLCPGDSFNLAPDQMMGNLQWQDGQNSTSLSGQLPGLYWLEMEANDCTFRDSVTITNSQILTINLGADTVICDDKTITLNAFHPNAQNYLWQDGSNQQEKTVGDPGAYQVQLDDGNCQFIFQREILFRECTYFSIYMPNAFTPNGDGVNDGYQPLISPKVQIESYLFQVYNRWGNLVYSTDDPNSSWDGSFNGKKSDLDTYISYVSVQYLDDDGPGRYEEGASVVLIR